MFYVPLLHLKFDIKTGFLNEVRISFVSISWLLPSSSYKLIGNDEGQVWTSIVFSYYEYF